MLQGLNDAKVEFVVIGGVAAFVQGSPHLTDDLDICYRRSEENLARLVNILRDWEAYPRGWEAGLPFVMDRRTFDTTAILTLHTSHGDLDLLDKVSGINGFETVLAESRRMTALGVTFRVLNLRALIRAKEATGRRKDEEHVRSLRALLALSDDASE